RFAGFLDLLLNQRSAEEMDAFERLCIDKKFLFAGTARGDIDRRPESHFGALPVEYQLHVTGAFEFLEDDIVHAAAGFDQDRGHDRKRTGFFGFTRGGEELAGLFERTDVEAAGSGATRIAGRIVSARKAGDRVD